MDVALNSYSLPPEYGEDSSKATIALNEYEKSVFLTKAQDEIFLNLYNGKNVYGDYFEGTEELRRYLNNLVRTKVLTEEDQINYLDTTKLSNDSIIYDIEETTAFITLEQVTLTNTSSSVSDKCKEFDATVYPVTQDEYARVKDNPFRGPTRYKVLRLDYGNNERGSLGKIELIPPKGYEIKTYLVKYLVPPRPIILIDLPDGLTINGNYHSFSECEMNPLLHNLILDRAVALAIQSKLIGANNNKTNRE